MIQFPSSTVVNRLLPKEAFYKRLALSADLKDRFVSDIRRITIENSLTVNTLHLDRSGELIEIIVLSLDLKKQQFDNRIIETIARQNPHKILFLLRYEELGLLALYTSKLYKRDWEKLSEMQLELSGFSLDEIWNRFVEQIALRNETKLPESEMTVAERLKRQDAIVKMEREIEKLEALARAEKQPKRKFELAMQVQSLQNTLRKL